MNIKDILQEFKEQLKIIYKDNLKDIILFGSLARGKFSAESDVDILIILNNIASYEEEFNKVFKVERDIEKKYDDKILISSVLATQKNYNLRLEPIYLNVQREGISI